MFTPVRIGDDIGHVVKGFAWIGIIGNIILFCFIMLMSFNNKLGTKIINFIIKILHKLKIVKNYGNAVEKMQVMFADYQQCIKKSMKKPGHFILQILLAASNILLNATIAYCIYLAFNYAYILDGTVIATEWLQVVCLSILCDAAASLMPLPGGSGAAELSFIGLFGLLFREDMKVWAMLFWRIFTYYGIILIGLVYVIGNSIISNRRSRQKYVINTKWTN